jgi:hypothetical protein
LEGKDHQWATNIMAGRPHNTSGRIILHWRYCILTAISEIATILTSGITVVLILWILQFKLHYTQKGYENCLCKPQIFKISFTIVKAPWNLGMLNIC